MAVAHIWNALLIRMPIVDEDRKSTRLNSSHANISYAVFCLKKKTYDNYRLAPHVLSRRVPPHPYLVSDCNQHYPLTNPIESHDVPHQLLRRAAKTPETLISC